MKGDDVNRPGTHESLPLVDVKDFARQYPRADLKMLLADAISGSSILPSSKASTRFLRSQSFLIMSLMLHDMPFVDFEDAAACLVCLGRLMHASILA